MFIHCVRSLLFVCCSLNYCARWCDNWVFLGVNRSMGHGYWCRRWVRCFLFRCSFIHSFVHSFSFIDGSFVLVVLVIRTFIRVVHSVVSLFRYSLVCSVHSFIFWMLFFCSFWFIPFVVVIFIREQIRSLLIIHSVHSLLVIH